MLLDTRLVQFQYLLHEGDQQTLTTAASSELQFPRQSRHVEEGSVLGHCPRHFKGCQGM